MCIIICIAIDLIAHLSSVAFHELVEHQRVVEHIDVIVQLSMLSMPKKSAKSINFAMSLPQE
jgi:hypothetical protein